MHLPVLADAVIKALSPRDGAIYIDGTYGGGGHARAILQAANARVIAVDRDPEAMIRARAHARLDSRLVPVQGRFGQVERIATSQGCHAVDGMVLDLGMSSFQTDQAERGFSFMHDGPLDMRMDTDGIDAADVIASASDRLLECIFRVLGEERAARPLARAVVSARAERPIRTTSDLAGIAARVLTRTPGRSDIHPATRCFQALRLYINDELPELARALAAAERLIGPGGRLVVISFHSLEDRMVKTFLRTRSGLAPRPSRHVPPGQTPPPSFDVPVRRAIRPGSAEVARNPRSRSARLRFAIRRNAACLIDMTHIPDWLPSLPAPQLRA